ncbi:ADP-ribosylglycohydrolase family protein [Neobacillus sp. Marseille-QA0830]
MDKKDRIAGSLIGLAVGDCVGAAVEFSPPGTFSPVNDMLEGGPHQLKLGQWTDDTSMALCLAQSLIECKEFNAEDQMQRYLRWYKEGYMSSTGECFDIGIGTREALLRYLDTGEPFSGSTDPYQAGNGSIMRLAPVPLAWADDIEQAIFWSGQSSKTTHQAEETIDACCYFGALIAGAVNGMPREQLLSKEFVHFVEEKMGRPLSPKIKEVAEGSYKHKQPPEIVGSGYVVKSLEAALWAFYLSGNFREGLLLAVNLGNDSDTTGAVYGQLAGAFYGRDAIPQRWVKPLAQLEIIEDMADNLHKLQTDMSAFAYKGKTCDYHLFFNEQDQAYYEVQINSQLEALVDGEWLYGIFKNAYIGTDFKWKVHFPSKRAFVLLPAGTKIRLVRDYLKRRPEKTPRKLGGPKELENFFRGRKKVEAKKKMGIR